MSNSKKNQFDGNYLERYRKGLLSPAEAHALEKEALEDPLLADALEGYMQAPRDTEAERAYLKSWIQERVDENQAAIRYIPRTNNFQPFLRVAAVFLILIGAAWLAYVLWLEPETPVLADRGAAPVATEPATTTVQPPTNAPTTPTTITMQQPETAKPKESPITPSTPEANTVKTASTNPESQTVGKNDEPQPQASQAPPVVQADKSTEEVDRGDGNVAKPMNAKETKRISIVQDDKTEEAPMPADGWSNYEQYLSQGKEAAPSNQNGPNQVILSFRVGADGRPSDIRVEKSGGTAQDEKAINLLKKGPGWKGGKSNKRAQLTVRF